MYALSRVDDCAYWSYTGYSPMYALSRVDDCAYWSYIGYSPMYDMTCLMRV
jgi:hypothetical protein